LDDNQIAFVMGLGGSRAPREAQYLSLLRKVAAWRSNLGLFVILVVFVLKYRFYTLGRAG
jgi:hypothetical protein